MEEMDTKARTVEPGKTQQTAELQYVYKSSVFFNNPFKGCQAQNCQLANNRLAKIKINSLAVDFLIAKIMTCPDLQDLPRT